MRVGTNNPKWLLSDHLGSQSIVASYDGLTEEGELRYKAWGETRYTYGDSIIPGAGQVQAWDRYAAMGNNPLRYIDPSGHSSVLHDSYGDASSSTLMINPWILDRDDKPSFTVYQSRAESDFVKKMNDPGVGLTVTTKFGANNTMGGKGQHAGVDFRGAWKSNTEIRATTYGIVVDVTTDPEADMGLKVIVEPTFRTLQTE